MSVPPPAPPPETGLTERQRRLILIGAVMGLVVLVAFVVWAIVGMLLNPTATETIRDIFIVVMALETLVIGAALIVLIVQIAQLTNLLRHEIKPILDSTNETINTLRGTTAFMSENLVEPVIKLNGYLAAMQRLLDGLRLFVPRR